MYAMSLAIQFLVCWSNMIFPAEMLARIIQFLVIIMTTQQPTWVGFVVLDWVLGVFSSSRYHVRFSPISILCMIMFDSSENKLMTIQLQSKE